MATVAVFATAISTGSCLMFLIEPMVAKVLLPVFGGTPNVWNTCVVFFQLLLIAGYLYSHFISTNLGFRAQVALHAFIIVAAAFLLPTALPATTDVFQNPVLSLLVLLMVLVGAPFFAVSTTAPLLAKWYSSLKVPGAHDPYFLYAASNAGGILGLLSYPFFIEPNLRLTEQTQLIGGMYIFYALLILASGFCRIRGAGTVTEGGPSSPEIEIPFHENDRGDSDAETSEISQRLPSNKTYLHWLILAIVPQSLVLGFTTYVTSELSAIPLFWIAPLLIYLVSFVIAFSRKTQSLRKAARIAALVCTLFSAVLLTEGGRTFGIDVLTVGLSVQLLTIFFVCCACHMEIAAQRPSPQHLTNYFLTMSIGGVIGSSINSFIAPNLFSDYIEYPLMLAAAGVLLIGSESVSRNRLLKTGVAALGLLMLVDWSRTPESVVLRKRNFFGCLSIDVNRTSNACEFYHGLTMHGSESLDPDERGVPISYYYKNGPIGKLFTHLFGAPETLRSLSKTVSLVPAMPSAAADSVFELRRKYLGELKSSAAGNNPITLDAISQSLDDIAELRKPSYPIGILGLGTGTIASFAKKNQPVIYYEIDPAVIELAENPIYFTYLFQAKQRGVDLRIVRGDGRLEIQKAPYKYFKVIVADAFSSDSIPMHLITKQALATYKSKLRDDGAVIFNISNHFYDLSSVLANLAADANLNAFIYADTNAVIARNESSATWVVLTSDENTKSILLENGWKSLAPNRRQPLWTDDFCSPLSVLISPLS